MTTRRQDDLTQDYWQNYVNGIWIDGGAGRLVVENPGTGQRLADIASASAADIGTAVAAAKAKAALLRWGHLRHRRLLPRPKRDTIRTTTTRRHSPPSSRPISLAHWCLHGGAMFTPVTPATTEIGDSRVDLLQWCELVLGRR